MTACLRGRGGLMRLLALAVAAGVAALLVGLSAARNALPGDTFQMVPRAPVPVIAAGSAADQAPSTRTGGYVYPRDGDADDEAPGPLPTAPEAAPALAFVALPVLAGSAPPVIAPRRRTCRAPPALG